MARDLSRKVKKETVPLTPCRFQIETAAFVDAVTAVSALMATAGVEPDKQIMLITAAHASPEAQAQGATGGAVVIECGHSGAYARMIVLAEVALPGYFTMPALTLRQIRWGSQKVIFTTKPDSRMVEYRGKIRGDLAVPASPDPVIRNRPKEKPEYSTLPKQAFMATLAASYFKAETLDDQDDVLVRVDWTKLKKPAKSGGTHRLSITVHDHYRAAFSTDECSYAGPNGTTLLPGSMLWQFLRACPDTATTFDVALTDTTGYFRTLSEHGGLLYVCPTVHGEVRNVRKWADSFVDDERDFQFVVDSQELIDGILEVSSVQDRDPEVEKRLQMQCNKDGKYLLLKVDGALGNAQRKVPIHQGSGGRVDLDFAFLLDSLNIFKKDNRPVRFTIWDGAARLEVQGGVKSTHFLSSMEQES